MLLFGSGLLVYAPHRNTSSIRNVEIKCFHGLVCCDLTALFTLKNQLILVFKKKKRKKSDNSQSPTWLAFAGSYRTEGAIAEWRQAVPTPTTSMKVAIVTVHQNLSQCLALREVEKKRKKCNVMMSEEVLYNMRPLSVTSCLLDAH